MKTFQKTSKCHQFRSAELERQHSLKILRTSLINLRHSRLHVLRGRSLNQLALATVKPPKTPARNSKRTETAERMEVEGSPTANLSRATLIAVGRTQKPRYRDCPVSQEYPSSAAALIAATEVQSRFKLLPTLKKWRARKPNRLKTCFSPNPLS